MSFGRCETVKVRTDSERGYKIIDKDDFDSNTDELYQEVKVTKPNDTNAGTEDALQDLKALKAEAISLGVPFAPTIGYDTLKIRVEEAKAE